METRQGQRAGLVNSDFLEDLVRRGDPDRHLSALSAEPIARRKLFALYGFNLEVARAAWASNDPVICAVRLNWWAEAVGPARFKDARTSNHLVSSVAELIRTGELPMDSFKRMIDARYRDLNREPFTALDEFDEYIDATSGELMTLAARTLGAPELASETVRLFARGSGAASFLRAVPSLSAKGWNAFGADMELVSDIVRSASERILAARRNRKKVPRSSTPALLAGWRAGAALGKAASDLQRIHSGQLEESEFMRRGTLLVRGFTGNW